MQDYFEPSGPEPRLKSLSSETTLAMRDKIKRTFPWQRAQAGNRSPWKMVARWFCLCDSCTTVYTPDTGATSPALKTCSALDAPCIEFKTPARSRSQFSLLDSLSKTACKAGATFQIIQSRFSPCESKKFSFNFAISLSLHHASTKPTQYR